MDRDPADDPHTPTQRVWERLYRYLRRRLGHEAAQDVTQEAMIQIWASAATYREIGASPQAWQYAVARHALSRHLRHRTPVLVPLADDLPAGADSDPERVRQGRAQLARLEAIVRELPPAQRRVVVLRLIERWSVDEVAARTGYTSAAIYKLCGRVLDKLEAALDDL